MHARCSSQWTAIRGQLNPCPSAPQGRTRIAGIALRVAKVRREEAGGAGAARAALADRWHEGACGGVGAGAWGCDKRALVLVP